MNALEFSATQSEIAKALLTAQKKFGPLFKKSDNPYFSSRYADLSEVIDTVSPALEEAEIVLIQGVSSDANMVHVETMLMHAPSCEWVKTVLTLVPVKADPQGFGSAITYGRRYGLQAICGIAAQDDDGNDASRTAPQKSSASQLPQRPGETIQGMVSTAYSHPAKNKDGTLTGGTLYGGKIGSIGVWTKDETLGKELESFKGSEVIAQVVKTQNSYQLRNIQPLQDDLNMERI
jgi:hypothetical protein